MSVHYKRIAITGPESSGKTTLAGLLHEHFGGTLIGEYARRYLAKTDGAYAQEDLDAIALGQMRQWIPAYELPIICDTEMTTLLIWSMERYGSVSDLIHTLFEKQQFDIYLLCRPDLEWESDPLRENEHDRDRLFALYEEKLVAARRPYRIIEGKERLQKALEILRTH